MAYLVSAEGDRLLESGRIGEATSRYRDALKWRSLPDIRAKLVYAEGLLLLQRNDLKGAALTFRRAAGMAPSIRPWADQGLQRCAMLANDRGNARFAKEDYAGAVSLYRMAQSCVPGEKIYRSNLLNAEGLIAGIAGNYTLAADKFREAQEVNPDEKNVAAYRRKIKILAYEAGMRAVRIYNIKDALNKFRNAQRLFDSPSIIYHTGENVEIQNRILQSEARLLMLEGKFREAMTKYIGDNRDTLYYSGMRYARGDLGKEVEMDLKLLEYLISQDNKSHHAYERGSICSLDPDFTLPEWIMYNSGRSKSKLKKLQRAWEGVPGRTCSIRG